MLYYAVHGSMELIILLECISFFGSANLVFNLDNKTNLTEIGTDYGHPTCTLLILNNDNS